MQQLLDKWERLRRSEYLRPDEKLMLNHCISDLNRFMDHSVDVTEMVGKMTAVEWIEQEMLKGNLSLKEILEQSKEIEKQRIENVWIAALDFGIEKMKGLNTLESKDAFDQFYNETYGGGNK